MQRILDAELLERLQRFADAKFPMVDIGVLVIQTWGGAQVAKFLAFDVEVREI